MKEKNVAEVELNTQLHTTKQIDRSETLKTKRCNKWESEKASSQVLPMRPLCISSTLLNQLPPILLFCDSMLYDWCGGISLLDLIDKKTKGRGTVRFYPTHDVLARSSRASRSTTTFNDRWHEPVSYHMAKQGSPEVSEDGPWDKKTSEKFETWIASISNQLASGDLLDPGRLIFVTARDLENILIHAKKQLREA